jgi:hypothetical protein
MHVGVFDGLPGSQTVLQADIEGVNIEALYQVLPDPRHHSPQCALFVAGQIVDAGDMSSRTYESMAFGEREGVRHCDMVLIAKQNACFIRVAEGTVLAQSLTSFDIAQRHWELR